MRIIDLSEFNEVYDWQLVKANADIVILRIGYRGGETGKITYDKRYKEYRKACIDYGIPYSLYWFPTAIDKKVALEEADFVINECQNMVFVLPIFADSEKSFPDGHGRADKLSKQTRTNLLKTFCDRLQSKGVPAGIYASLYWWKDNLITDQLPYSKWIAQYAPKCDFEGEYLMWQYTSSAKITGINGNVDMSILSTDIPVMQVDKAGAVLKEAAKWIGTKEDPPNSNNVIFNTHYYGRKVSGVNYAWCCAFVWDIFRMCGLSELFYDGKKTAYCPTVESYYKSIGRWFSYPQRGDLALFNWSGGKVAQHIGFVEQVKEGTIITIEGNTSVTSNDNGGSVMRMERKISQCTGFARPAYGMETVSKSPAVDTSTYPTLRYGDSGAWVYLLQNALILRGYPVEATGSFNNVTKAQVLSFQKNYKLSVDGVVGQKTWGALFS